MISQEGNLLSASMIRKDTLNQSVFLFTYTLGPSGQIVTPGYLEEQEVYGGLDCDWHIKCKKNQVVEISFDYFKLPSTLAQTRMKRVIPTGLPEEIEDYYLTQALLLSPDYNLEACG